MSKEKPNFDNLKQKLEEHYTWPSEYIFKFIFIADNDKLIEIMSLFEPNSVQYEIKASSKGKYSSLSIKKKMISTEEVIEIYEAVGKIDGVMAL
jgi:uncharacterized protein